ncbi:MAG: hypothetical protein ACREAC_03070 [Blastocatellia bacterium]
MKKLKCGRCGTCFLLKAGLSVTNTLTYAVLQHCADTECTCSEGIDRDAESVRKLFPVFDLCGTFFAKVLKNQMAALRCDLIEASVEATIRVFHAFWRIGRRHWQRVRSFSHVFTVDAIGYSVKVKTRVAAVRGNDFS